MKAMKKSLLTLASGILLSSSVYGVDKFVAFPILNDPTYKPNIEVALIGGYVGFANNDLDGGSMYGLEVSLDCPVFTLAGDNLIRQQLSVNKYSKNSADVTTIEMNPYYFMHLSKDLLLGFGPGIGAAFVDVPGKETWLFTYQAGAGLKYYINKNVLVGLDVRWQGSVDKDYTGSGKDDNLNNTRTLAKVGYRF
jgi:opacity protein-like surface antigen